MQNAGNAFSLPFRDPNWFGTFALIGLIGLIPIIGQINTYGWMLTLLDNYRQGRTDLPPAGFQYLGRGGNLFVVMLVYGLVIAAIVLVPVFLLFASAFGTASAGGTANPAAFSGLQGYSLGINGIQLVLYLFLPAVIVATERGGIGAGLNPANVLRIGSANWGHTLVAGVLVLAAGIAGSLGIIACCIGIIVTAPYSQAVIAGLVRFYEATFETGHPILPQDPTPPASIA
ncbi:MAG: DUF4013 domain-containing protein [Candidatus Dormibacteria bacterium]